ncbi:MAG: hypothetical protein ACRDAX_03285 [Propionibacteriaceae bacterium]
MTIGQLVYTVFDLEQGQCGGWGVKESVGIDADVIPAIVARCPTALGFIEKAPSFATQDQVATMPRRMAVGPVSAGSWLHAVWNSLDSGLDATGRPNVFTHVYIPDKQIRHIELWRNRGWLTPFGARQINETSLIAGGPLPVDLSASTALFLQASDTWRVGTLCVLADAVAQAFKAGEQPVVMLLDAMEEAPWWISALQYVMSCGTADRLCYSTYERASAVNSWADFGYHVVGVPKSDAEQLLKQYKGVIIDMTQTPELGQYGQTPHRVMSGDFYAGEWSTLILDALADPSGLPQLKEELDQIAARVGDVGLDPAWPLAMRVSLLNSSDVVYEAACVIQRATPDTVINDQELFDAVAASLSVIAGNDPMAIANQMFQHKQYSGSLLVGKLLAVSYASALISDETKLNNPSLIMPPQEYKPVVVGDVAANMKEYIKRLRDKQRSYQISEAFAGQSLYSPAVGGSAVDEVAFSYINYVITAINMRRLVHALGWEEKLSEDAQVAVDTYLAPIAYDKTANSVWQLVATLPYELKELINKGFRELASSRMMGDRIAPDALRVLELSSGRRLLDSDFVVKNLQTNEVSPLAVELAVYVLDDPNLNNTIAVAAAAVLLAASDFPNSTCYEKIWPRIEKLTITPTQIVDLYRRGCRIPLLRFTVRSLLNSPDPSPLFEQQLSNEISKTAVLMRLRYELTSKNSLAGVFNSYEYFMNLSDELIGLVNAELAVGGTDPIVQQALMGLAIISAICNPVGNNINMSTLFSEGKASLASETMDDICKVLANRSMSVNKIIVAAGLLNPNIRNSESPYSYLWDEYGEEDSPMVKFLVHLIKPLEDQDCSKALGEATEELRGVASSSGDRTRAIEDLQKSLLAKAKPKRPWLSRRISGEGK